MDELLGVEKVTEHLSAKGEMVAEKELRIRAEILTQPYLTKPYESAYSSA